VHFVLGALAEARAAQVDGFAVLSMHEASGQRQLLMMWASETTFQHEAAAAATAARDAAKRALVRKLGAVGTGTAEPLRANAVTSQWKWSPWCSSLRQKSHT
jgi:hypothetical protein